MLKVHAIYRSAIAQFDHYELKKQISGNILEIHIKCIEINANEKCEQNCCEHPSERETALIRLMKTGYEFNVGLGKIKTGHEINKSRNEFAHNLRINWNDKQFS